MKKILLSIIVLGAFFAYGLHQKQEAANVKVSAPATLQITPTTSGGVTPPTQSVSQGKYKDGVYTGNIADAFYGNVQVKLTIQQGKITDVVFLDYPHDRGTSIEINTQAMPFLREEAIQSQSANVDIVSGATQTSEAFRQSFSSALSQAQ